VSEKINNGGPAFPSGSVRKHRPLSDPGSDWVEVDRVQPLHAGLSLRDYFAIKALPIAWSAYDQGYAGHQEFVEQSIARHAYILADEMLKARSE
jgi:hypothetical protein